MLKLFRLLFSGLNRYSLSISRIYKKDTTLFCTISDKININPFHIKIADIMSNEKLLSKINPKEIVMLSEIYNKSKPPLIKLTASQGDNYILKYYGKTFTMQGKLICQDIDLLKALGAEDAFKVTYETAYKQAMKAYKESFELSNSPSEMSPTTLDNIIHLHKDKDYHKH